jgi:hypothetical protein
VPRDLAFAIVPAQGRLISVPIWDNGKEPAARLIPSLTSGRTGPTFSDTDLPAGVNIVGSTISNENLDSSIQVFCVHVAEFEAMNAAGDCRLVATHHVVYRADHTERVYP